MMTVTVEHSDTSAEPAGPGPLTADDRPAALPEPPVRLLGTFWRANTAGWIFIALFGIAARLLAFDSLPLALGLTAVLEPIGFCLTALVHKVLQSRVRLGAVSVRVLGFAFVLSVVGGTLQMVVANAIKAAMQADGSGGLSTGGDIIPCIYYASIFFGWSLAYFWLKADNEARTQRLRHSEAQQAAVRAELMHLRQQIDPHFLFNVLNTLVAEIPDRPQTALEMTHRIAAWLRYSLEQHDRPVCLLRDEIEAIRSYLRIQELRFEERLTCIIEADPSASRIPVPHLIVQGLVENAIKHGLRSGAEHLIVRLRTHVDGDTLHVEVSNTGTLSTPADGRRGLGLANTRRRLALHYPRSHELTLVQTGDTVVARLTLRGMPCFA